WGLQREQVCAGLRGAHAEIERRLDGTHWLRFRGRYLPLSPCPNAPRSKPNTVRRPITLGGNHGSGHFYLAKNRTFLLCVDTGVADRQHPLGARVDSLAFEVARRQNPAMAHHLTTSYTKDALDLFRYYKRLAERAIEQCPDEELFSTLDAESNSIAIIVK